MCVNPWVVGADRHDRQIDRLRSPGLPERMRHSGVAAEQHTPVSRLDDIAVEAAIRIRSHARSPMLHFEGSHVRLADLDVFSPRKFAHSAVPLVSNQIACSQGGYDLRVPMLER